MIRRVPKVRLESDASRNAKMAEYVRKEYIDSDGKGRILIRIPEDYEVLDPLTMGGQKELNQEIFDCIDRKSDLIPSAVKLRIEFHGRVFSEAEQEETRNLVREHYQVEQFELQWDLDANLIRFWKMILIGTLFLGLYFFLELTEYEFFTELVSVIGSFSLWTAAELWMIDRRDLKKQMIWIEQVKSAELVFEGDSGHSEHETDGSAHAALK